MIAIDGVAGAGKSTLAQALSDRLGVDRLDTGAMYRAVALAALRRGLAPGDAARLAELARGMSLEVAGRVLLDGEDVTEAIRSPEVDAVVSVVAAHREVREELVSRQRCWATGRDGAVVEGRDIGTVVLPDATLKIFLTAAPAVRARRRARQAGVPGEGAGGVEALARRDRSDSSRAASPLAVADGARVLDSSDRSVEELVEEVLGWL